MLRRLALATVITAAMTSARPAAADGFYFFEGLGASRYRDEVVRYTGETGLHIRAGIGWRLGHVAVELFGRGEITANDWVAAERSEGTPIGPSHGTGPSTFGVDIKVLQPLSTHWTAYARAGLSRMMMDDYAGRGLGATAGIQLAGKVRALGFLAWPLFFVNAGPKVHGALWFETGTSFHRLHGDGPSIDARVDGWTLGFAVGQDF